MIRLAAFLPCSEVNGPGRRAVVWVQGCSLSPPCPGCINPGFLDLEGEAEEVSVDALADRILAIDGLDGVTFSGGEPFAHAEPLARLARRLRAQGLDITVFSGYPLRVLRSARRPDYDALLQQVDLLVAGPYRSDLPASGALLGSTNQRLHFLTSRIGEADLAPLAESRWEVVLDPSGEATVTGFPGAEVVAMLQDPKLRRRSHD